MSDNYLQSATHLIQGQDLGPNEHKHLTQLHSTGLKQLQDVREDANRQGLKKGRGMRGGKEGDVSQGQDVAGDGRITLTRKIPARISLSGTNH